MTERRRTGLGKGLGALIPPAPTSTNRPVDVFFPDETETPSPATAGNTDDASPKFTTSRTNTSNTSSELNPVPGATFAEVPTSLVEPNPNQPRTVFDEDDLNELAASVREVGVLQPIVVRRSPRDDDRYEIVMGERRWRASQAAGLDTVPAIIRETADTDLLRDALLENLHRAQLNPLEEAAAYQQLLDDFACTHEELATRIARSRPQISNTLRLLRLPPAVQRRVAAGVLSAGHARALLSLPDHESMDKLAHRIVAEGLSVRATEEIVALGEEPQGPEMRGRRRVGTSSPEWDELSRVLSDRWETRVKVAMGQRKGKLQIEFANSDDLQRILTEMAPGVSAPTQN